MRLAAFFFLALAGASFAAPLTRDLGEGLAYHRAAALPAELPAAEAKPQPLVLDLRFALARDDATESLASWLKSHATRTTPVIVLVNAETAAAVIRTLAALPSQPGLLTLGSSAAGWTPDITLAPPLDAERRAYDAFAAGASLDSLLRQNTDKPRRDEAALMRGLANPVEEGSDDDLVDPAPDDDAAKLAPADPPPPTDVALQRAVHLHRALLALKRL